MFGKPSKLAAEEMLFPFRGDAISTQKPRTLCPCRRRSDCIHSFVLMLASFSVRLEKLPLWRLVLGRLKKMSGQRWQPSETELTMLLFKALPDQVRYRASSGHPCAKAGVIFLSTMHLSHQAKHMRSAVREVQLEPFSPNVLNLVR